MKTLCISLPDSEGKRLTISYLIHLIKLASQKANTHNLPLISAGGAASLHNYGGISAKVGIY